MNIKIVYDNNKDKELIELYEFSIPFFMEYIDTRTKDGKKEAYRIKSEYGARKNPFVVITDDKDKFIQCFWSESGNAVQQLINAIKVYDCKNYN